MKQVYDPNYHPKQAELICAQTGATITQLAVIFEFDPKTVFGWRARHPAFAQAVERGLDAFRRDVAEVGLEKRMRGYTYVEETFKWETDAETGERNKVLTKAVSKDRAPDTEAIKFFLLNRCPERWGKDAQQVAEDGDSLKAILQEINKCNADQGRKLSVVKPDC